MKACKKGEHLKSAEPDSGGYYRCVWCGTIMGMVNR